MLGPVHNGLVDRVLLTADHGGGKAPYRFNGNIVIIKSILTVDSHRNPVYRCALC